MKYLKLYEESIFRDSVCGIQKDLKDICLELQDVGFKIAITELSYMRIKLIIYKKRFLYSEVSEEVERIKDYMTDKGFKTNVIISKYVFKGRLNEVGIEMDRIE